MPLTQIYSKVGKYVQIGLVIIGIVLLGYFALSPPVGTGDDGQLVDSLRVELTEAVRINGELMVIKLDLERELETGKRINDSLRSIIDESIGENLGAGDLIIESGILTDDSLLILRELRRRLD